MIISNSNTSPENKISIESDKTIDSTKQTSIASSDNIRTQFTNSGFYNATLGINQNARSGSGTTLTDISSSAGSTSATAKNAPDLSEQVKSETEKLLSSIPLDGPPLPETLVNVGRLLKESHDNNPEAQSGYNSNFERD